jgi:tetratricopeptide (TPR) repeat protein
MRDPIEEPGQLAALEEFLAPCIALVTFNGKAFDVPLLATRYMLQGWQPPFREQVHIDLLHLARRLWRLRLPSRTLPTLEFNILKSMRTEQDIPGWMIPQIYFDYLRSGDARPLKNVFYHNAMDVLSLAALLNLTAGLLADPLHAQVEHGLDLVALGRLYEDQGNLDLTEQLYLQSLQSELPDEVHLDTLARLAYLYKRQDRLDEAVSLWEKAAQRKHLESHIELAKFYEHRLQRYDKAIFWTQQALELVDEPGFTTYEWNYWINELEHRLHRLQRLQRKSHD